MPRIIRSTLCLEFNNGVAVAEEEDVVLLILLLLLLILLLLLLLLLTACCCCSDEVVGELTYAPYAIPNSIPYAVP